MKRRHFLFVISAASLTATVPLASDEYGDFIRRVRARVIEIVDREGHGVRKMEIDPVVAGSRVVHLELDHGTTFHFPVRFSG